MATRLWKAWMGIASIKQKWSGNNIDGQARDLMFEGKLYDDNVSLGLMRKLYDFARQDGYIIDGWHSVPFEAVATLHETELKEYLRTCKPFCSRDDKDPFQYYYLAEGRFVERTRYGIIDI